MQNRPDHIKALKYNNYYEGILVDRYSNNSDLNHIYDTFSKTLSPSNNQISFDKIGLFEIRNESCVSYYGDLDINAKAPFCFQVVNPNTLIGKTHEEFIFETLIEELADYKRRTIQ